MLHDVALQSWFLLLGYLFYLSCLFWLLFFFFLPGCLFCVLNCFCSSSLVSFSFVYFCKFLLEFVGCIGFVFSKVPNAIVMLDNVG